VNLLSPKFAFWISILFQAFLPSFHYLARVETSPLKRVFPFCVNFNPSCFHRRLGPPNAPCFVRGFYHKILSISHLANFLLVFATHKNCANFHPSYFHRRLGRPSRPFLSGVSMKICYKFLTWLIFSLFFPPIKLCELSSIMLPSTTRSTK